MKLIIEKNHNFSCRLSNQYVGSFHFVSWSTLNVFITENIFNASAEKLTF
jgi:hypothetical protein